MFEEITKYIDRILNIVRPRKLVYFAIDGVAPRAKMNQQRSRRFRASRDQKFYYLFPINQEDALTHMRDIVKQKGYTVPDVVEKVPFDSNCITPGTKFMSDLTKYLQEYISMKLKSAPAWQDLLIILSDSRVPGEGEHKIMDFIRKQRGISAKSSYDPNMVHCIYGADADLIMLGFAILYLITGLSTHEPNFLIIREEFRPTMPNRQCPICMKFGINCLT
ncbi:LOW QUALITY PROTEIN: hypothetical protein MXB_4571 [Myxobolus squamalis]|nr:LOW QUALITY PROTEIN: hypothetical protein MXB_4571 [Myxobolus squamalis]